MAKDAGHKPTSRALDGRGIRTPPGLFRRLIGRADGTTTVEFALVAIPFLTLIFIMLNSALMMFYNATIQGALWTVARLIETGQTQYSVTCPPTKAADISAEASAATALKQAVCNGTFNLLSCTDPNLLIDVRSFTTYSALSLPVMNATTQNCVNTGGSGSIVAIRLGYNWNNIAPLVGLAPLLHFDASTPSQIQYTMIVKNEPF